MSDTKRKQENRCGTDHGSAEQRPFQFGVKHLLVLMVFLAVSCSLAPWEFSVWVIIFALICSAFVFDIVRLSTPHAWEAAAMSAGVALIVLLGITRIFTIYNEVELASIAAITCRNNLYECAGAIRWYESNHGHLPPAYVTDESGKPIHSWRVLILPCLDRNDLYTRYNFDEPWDGPNNRNLHGIMPVNYTCVIEDRSGRRGQSTMTNYVAVVGPGTVWPGEETVKLSDLPSPESTVLLVEVANSDIHWMEPRDLTLDELLMEIDSKADLSISCKHSNRRPHVLFADGSIKTLGKDLTIDELKSMLTIRAKPASGKTSEDTMPKYGPNTEK